MGGMVSRYLTRLYAVSIRSTWESGLVFSVLLLYLHVMAIMWRRKSRGMACVGHRSVKHTRLEPLWPFTTFIADLCVHFSAQQIRIDCTDGRCLIVSGAEQIRWKLRVISLVWFWFWDYGKCCCWCFVYTIHNNSHCCKLQRIKFTCLMRACILLFGISFVWQFNKFYRVQQEETRKNNKWNYDLFSEYKYNI